VTIGEYVKKIREDKQITQRGLALKAGVSNSTISNLEAGKRIPSLEIFKAIAKALNIDFMDILAHLESDAAETIYTKEDMIPVQMIQLPVVGTVRAGMPILAVENIERYVPVASMYLSKSKEYFVLQVTGDSMDQLFPGGTLAVIEKTDEIEDGKIAVVAINGNEATIKKVQFAGEGIMLIPMSHNPKHQPTFYHMEKDEVHIIGRLKLSMTEY
jgi:repressor LexA